MKKSDLLLVVSIVQVLMILFFWGAWALDRLPIDTLGLAAVTGLISFSASLYYWAWRNFNRP